MNQSTKANIFFYLSLLCAIWFVLTCMAWTYAMNVVISFPFGIISYVLWRKGKKIDTRVKRYRAIDSILLIGVALAVGSLIYFLIYE